MRPASRKAAAFLLVVLPTVIFGGTSLLTLLISDPAYAENQLRQDLWRAGHAHAGVFLLLALVVLRYVDEARLPAGLRHFARWAAPAAAIFLPLAFFFSVLTPDATEPNGMIYLAYVGAVVLAAGLVILGIGLWRAAGED